MVTVNMHEAKTQLSKLVERVEAGEEVVIARSGKPVAKLVPVKRDMTPRVMGTMKGLIHMSDDFDDPLPPEIEASFYGVTPEELDKFFPPPSDKKPEPRKAGQPKH
jgi:prevent-host-death family protein